MGLLIWGGACVTVLGFAGIIWSLVAVLRARRSAPSDDALRARIGRMMPVNLAAFLLSVLGLMLVVLGIVFG
ncbi:MAG: hypothetical protein H3C51_06335 [Rubellimicrobium sp.]|nr:hypothetical protein [Rubellimicrobium sp.]